MAGDAGDLDRQFGLTDREYERVIGALLAEADVAEVLDDAQAAGLDRAAILEDLRRERLVDARLWREVDEASDGAVAALAGTRARLDLLFRRRHDRQERLDRAREGAPVALAMAAAVGLVGALAWWQDAPGLAAVSIALALLLLPAAGLLRLAPALARLWPPARRDEQGIRELARVASRQAERVTATVQDALGRMLRPKLTEVVRARRAEALHREQRAAEAAAGPVMLPGTEAPALLNATKTVKVVDTEGHRRVAAMVGQQQTAAIGIAGPRGAGKSTLIERFCRSQLEPRPPGADGEGGRRPVFGVKTSVPVRYQPRDFVLHLYAETCREILRLPGPWHRSLSPTGLSEHAWLRRRTVASAALLLGSLALVAAGLFGLGWTLLPEPWGLVTGGTLLVALGAVAAGSRPLPGGVRSAGFAALAALLAAGGATVVVWALTPAEHLVLAISIVALVAGLAAALHAAHRAREALDRLRFPNAGFPTVLEDEELKELGHTVGSPHLVLRRMSARRLHGLQWQQALTESAQGSASVSVPLSLPLKIEASTSRERSLTERPQPHPELISDYRGFLTLIRETLGADVLVGIDELDKIATDAEALAFLNDIKDLFQVDSCYFLVSVSESALHSFARRGLPVRDAFDTAFDQIVRLGEVSLAESAGLLGDRTIDLPWQVAVFSHAFSGGLPRDLIRVARRVFEFNATHGGAAAVEELFTEVLFEDLWTQLRSSIAVARDREDWASLESLLALTELVPREPGDPEGLAAALHDTIESRWRLEPGDGAAASDTCLGVRAYLYYLASALLAFARGWSAGEWDARRAEVERVADDLAWARRDLAIHPRQSWTRTSTARAVLELGSLPWDAQRAAGAGDVRRPGDGWGARLALRARRLAATLRAAGVAEPAAGGGQPSSTSAAIAANSRPR